MVVCAPAGSGKTTLLAEWRATHGVRAAWIALEETDDDACRFCEVLAASLGAAMPALVLPVIPPANRLRGWIEDVCVSLAARRASNADVFSIVIDDCHILTRAEVLDGVACLLDHLPPRCRLVVSTRTEPLFPLARLRARGELVEVRGSDLRFTMEETRLLLNGLWQLGLADRAVASLAARTEGWAAGLHLAALSLRGSKDPSVFIARFDGTNRHVLDYLVDEVLGRQPAAVKDFLLATSLLARLCGPLCDALTGRADGQETLERLEDDNVFVSALDEQRRWFRYHPLFSDVLRRRLARSVFDAVELHRAAAAWLEVNGHADEAVPHALAARRYDEASALIESVAERVMQEGRETSFVRWLDEIPAQSLDEHPVLLAYRDVALAIAGGSAPDVQPAAEGTLVAGGRAAARAICEYESGRLAACIPHAEEALSLLPEDRCWLRGTTSLLLATVQIHCGDFAAAAASIALLLARARATDNLSVTVTCLRRLHSIEVFRGRLGLARGRCEEALGLAFEGARPLPVHAATWFLVAEAHVARLGGDLDESDRLLDRADAVAADLDDGPPADILEARACLQLARGDRQRALALQRQAALLAALPGKLDLGSPVVYRALLALHADDTGPATDRVRGDACPGGPGLLRKEALHAALPERLDVRSVGGVNARRVLLALQVGDAEPARDWARSMERQVVLGLLADGAAGAGAGYLSAMMDGEILARLCLAQGEHAEAARIAGLLADAASRHEHLLAEVRVRLLEACALDAAGKAAEARQATEQGLARAEPAGLISLFLEEGEPIPRLIHEVYAGGAQAWFAGRVLAAFLPREASRACANLPGLLAEPLSGRELEILSLMAEGLSNKEIADRLFVSEKTVKWHDTNIYGKLGVSRRTQAVARGRALNLLPRDGRAPGDTT